MTKDQTQLQIKHDKLEKVVDQLLVRLRALELQNAKQKSALIRAQQQIAHLESTVSRMTRSGG